MARRNGRAIGAAVVVVLAMFGSCSDDDDPSGSSSTVAATTTTVAPQDRDVWVGTVASYPTSYGFAPEIGVDLGNGHLESVTLAHLGEPICGNYAASDARSASVRSRIQELVPIGTQVTIVRGRELRGTTARFTDEGFVFVEAPAPLVTATSTTAAPTTSPPATPTDAPTTATRAKASKATDVDGTGTETAGQTTAVTPATTSTTPEASGEILVNEALVMEGLASLSDPDIDLSAVATRTVEQQLHSGPSAIEVEPNLSYFDRLLSAHRVAWDGGVGFMADCRAKEADDILKQQQRDELDRIRRGPDGQLGTSDDDNRLWKHDENGNVYIDTPSVSSGDGGGGGGGGFCSRRRWC